MKVVIWITKTFIDSISIYEKLEIVSYNSRKLEITNRYFELIIRYFEL